MYLTTIKKKKAPHLDSINFYCSSVGIKKKKGSMTKKPPLASTVRDLEKWTADILSGRGGGEDCAPPTAPIDFNPQFLPAGPPGMS